MAMGICSLVLIYTVILKDVFYVSSVELAYKRDSIITQLIGDCTGSDKSMAIKKREMQYISYVVFGDNEKKKKYLYNEMSKLARDPDIDFKNKRTLMFYSGYLDSTDFPVIPIIARAYKAKKYNVIAMDVNYFQTFRYPISVRYMRPLAKIATKMLLKLMKEGLDPNKLDLIGLSLGGQTISVVAKEYRAITGKNLTRLTAMDPAGPCFEDVVGPEDRLQKSDADYVEVINTNSKGLGITEPVGHVNFYVNGGDYQPGDIWWYPCMNFCSHIRAYFLWESALKHPNKFIAIKCDSVEQARNQTCLERRPIETNVLGLNVDKKNEGIFYLPTSYAAPYYLGDRVLKEKFKYNRNKSGAINLIDAARFWF